ncbi:MAG: hypothetical protein IJG09_09955 [Methanobrevibacter sp.]|nr:hypothetical protein [Methanobrevibacter sp.]
MGHKKEINKLEVQKAKLKCVFHMLLATEINIMDFQLTLTDDPKTKKAIKKLIKDSQKAQDIVMKITHYEILVSLYNSFVNNKESYFVMLSTTINAKNKITRWDRTEKGFKEFLLLEQQAKAQTQKELEERKQQQEMLQQAKKDGKKIEFAYQDGKLKPIIVETEPN